MSDQNCDHQINVPDAGQPLVYFIIVTAIYSYLNYSHSSIPTDINFFNGTNNIENINKNSFTSLLIYILLLIVGNYFININISKEVCGNVQWWNTFIITILPWSLIFLLIIVIIKMFPGWLAPFSNTIGYLIANFSGLEKLIDEILKPQSEVVTGNIPSNPDQALVQYNLTQIYGDKSLLINEITIDNFEIFWNRFSKAGLLDTKQIEEEEKNNVFLKNELFNYLVLKNTIAEFIWYLLTGLLVTSVSYNYIVNSSCKQSIKEMEATHNAYLKLQEQLNLKNKNTTSYTVG